MTERKIGDVKRLRREMLQRGRQSSTVKCHVVFSKEPSGVTAFWGRWLCLDQDHHCQLVQRLPQVRDLGRHPDLLFGKDAQVLREFLASQCEPDHGC